MIHEVQRQEYGNDTKRRYAAGAASADGGSGVPLRHNAVSALIPSPTGGWPVVRADQASPSMVQPRGIKQRASPLRHLDDTVQADIDVSP